MELERAKELLEILADGIDPTTGEILPPEDSVNHPEIVRALHVAVALMENKVKQSKRKQPENYGKPWTAADDILLSRMYDDGISSAELCAFFKRTKGSIAARLVHLGKIQDRYAL